MKSSHNGLAAQTNVRRYTPYHNPEMTMSKEGKEKLFEVRINKASKQAWRRATSVQGEA